MNRMTKALATVCLTFVCCCGATLAYGDWSQGWTQNYFPEAFGPFTKIEFFIMPGAPAGVSFEAATSIKTSKGWTSVLTNPAYSVLTGPKATTAFMTTYFTGPTTAKFDVDFVLWDGNTVVERQEFDWLGGTWKNPQGALIKNASGGYDPGEYNRSSSGSVVPVPSAVLLLLPACFGILLLRKCAREV